MANDDRIELAAARLAKARKEHRGVAVNIDAGLYEIAITRAYYCVFHSMRAILALDGVSFKSHSQVIGYFNNHYIKSGVFERTYSRLIRLASDSRGQSDYEDYYEATLEEAQSGADNAEAFMTAVEAYVAERIKSEVAQSAFIQETLENGDEAENHDDEDEYVGDDDEDEWDEEL